MARFRRVAMTCGPLQVRHLGGIFAVGNVADMVLDLPIPADPLRQLS
jgi:hypothetical protein